MVIAIRAEAGRQPLPGLGAHGMGGVKVGGDGEVHNGGPVGQQVADLVDLVGPGNTHLARPQLLGFPFDFKGRPAFQDQKDLVPQVMAVAAVDLPRLHPVQPGAYLRGYQNVAVGGAVIIGFKGHQLFSLS